MHSHILPGIDDGSPDTESSIRYIRGLKELGYDSLFMTPHILPGVHPNDPNTITQSFHKLKEALPEDLTKWMQLGTAADATEFIRVIEKRQGYKIGCIEEVAYRKGFINREQLDVLAEGLIKSGYGAYLRQLK